MLCYRKHEWFAIAKTNPPVFETKIRGCIFCFSDAILTRFELVGNYNRLPTNCIIVTH